MRGRQRSIPCASSAACVLLFNAAHLRRAAKTRVVPALRNAEEMRKLLVRSAARTDELVGLREIIKATRGE